MVSHFIFIFPLMYDLEKPELRAPKCNCCVKCVSVLASSIFLLVPVPEADVELDDTYLIQFPSLLSLQHPDLYEMTETIAVCRGHARSDLFNPFLLCLVFMWGIMPGHGEPLHSSAAHGHSELPSERGEVLASLVLGSFLQRKCFIVPQTCPKLFHFRSQTFSLFLQAIASDTSGR